MMSRVSKYKGTPDIVYLNKSTKKDWVSYTCFVDMKKRYDAYKAKKGEPTTIHFQKPTATTGKTIIITQPNKGPIQKSIEAFLGSFTTITQALNKSIGRGYKHEYNDTLSLSQEIIALKNKTGLNCANAAQLFGQLAIEMGYKIAYEHVICKSSGGHMRLLIDGKEFGDHGSDARNWKLVDPAAMLSTGTKAKLGQVWCADGERIGITKPNGQYIGQKDAWMISDDGKT